MFLKKKKETTSVVEIEGINKIPQKLNINKLIINLGGYKNVLSVVGDDKTIKCEVKDHTKIKLDFFRRHKAFKGLFLKNDKISFVIGSNIDLIVKEIKIICNCK